MTCWHITITPSDLTDSYKPPYETLVSESGQQAPVITVPECTLRLFLHRLPSRITILPHSLGLLREIDHSGCARTAARSLFYAKLVPRCSEHNQLLLTSVFYFLAFKCIIFAMQYDYWCKHMWSLSSNQDTPFVPSIHASMWLIDSGSFSTLLQLSLFHICVANIISAYLLILQYFRIPDTRLKEKLGSPLGLDVCLQTLLSCKVKWVPSNSIDRPHLHTYFLPCYLKSTPALDLNSADNSDKYVNGGLLFRSSCHVSL